MLPLVVNPATITIATNLLRTPAGCALISRGVNHAIPYFLDNDPPNEEENKWQNRLEKESNKQMNEDPEKERGRGDKGNMNRLENADNKGKVNNSIQKEIADEGKQNIIDKTKEEMKNINKKEPIDSYRDMINSERGWEPDGGSKLEVPEPLENSFLSDQFALSPEQEQNFIQLAQVDNFSNNSPILNPELEISNVSTEYDSVDMDMDANDGDGDGGDGGGDGE